VWEQIAVESIAGLLGAVVTFLAGAGLRAGGGGWLERESDPPVGARAAQQGVAGRDLTQVIDQSDRRTYVHGGGAATSTAPGWSGVVVAGVGGLVALLLFVAFAERVVSVTALAAIGVAAGAGFRALRSRQRAGAFDQARWVALGHVALCLTGVTVALRGALTLERDGVSVDLVRDHVMSMGPSAPGLQTQLALVAELGRPAWEVCWSTLGGVVLAWFLIALAVLELRSWAIGDRAIRREPSSAAVERRLAAFARQRAEGLLLTVGLVAITWLVVRGNVADLVRWIGELAPGMFP
jgi:hypothetical protein